MAVRYPLMLDLEGRPCLVVGGGAVATRKVLGLLGSGARVTIVSPALSAPLAQLAAVGSVRWAEGRYASLARADDGRPWAFVVAATDELRRELLDSVTDQDWDQARRGFGDDELANE